MNWSQQVFNYCERGLNPAFWAEPVNAITNLAFIIAALIALYIGLRKTEKPLDIYHYCLIGLVTLIGIGSGLFHTYATRWSLLADVIPIGVFMIAYLIFATHRLLGYSIIGVAIALSAFFAAGYGFAQIRCEGGPCLNGSLGYAPALLAMLFLGLLAIIKRKPGGASLITAGLVFTVSVTFRSIDIATCHHTTLNAHEHLGTHFLWHVLNAVTLFILLRAAVLYGHKEQKNNGEQH